MGIMIGPFDWQFTRCRTAADERSSSQHCLGQVNHPKAPPMTCWKDILPNLLYRKQVGHDPAEAALEALLAKAHDSSYVVRRGEQMTVDLVELDGTERDGIFCAACGCGYSNVGLDIGHYHGNTLIWQCECGAENFSETVLLFMTRLAEPTDTVQ
jgi:hypothetical protein